MDRIKAQGNQPDLYRYSGDPEDVRAAQRMREGSGMNVPAQQCDTNDAICNWRPDAKLQTQQAKQWHDDNQRSRSTPLDVNADGTYTVKRNDCLETIAERELRCAGAKADRHAIDNEVKALIQLNKDRYPTLDCNSEFLADGWRLRLNPQLASGSTDRDLRRDDVARQVSNQGNYADDRRYPVARTKDYSDDRRYPVSRSNGYANDSGQGAALAANLFGTIISGIGGGMLNRGRRDYYDRDDDCDPRYGQGPWGYQRQGNNFGYDYDYGAPSFSGLINHRRYGHQPHYQYNNQEYQYNNPNYQYGNPNRQYSNVYNQYNNRSVDSHNRIVYMNGGHPSRIGW